MSPIIDVIYPNAHKGAHFTWFEEFRLLAMVQELATRADMTLTDRVPAG